MRTAWLFSILAAVGASTAQAVTPGQVMPAPINVPLTTLPPPSATVDVSVVASALQATMSGASVAVQLGGANIGLGGSTLVLSAGSALYARVIAVNAAGTTAPAGTYQVRFNVTNVGTPSTLRLSAGNGTTGSCALAARPGYANLQSCDLSVTTSGAAIMVSADSLVGAPQLEIRSVQVFKLR